MGQKIEYYFQFKDPIQFMLTSFSALFRLSNALPFSLIKSVFAISLERIFSPYVTHFNEATYSKTCTTVKRLMKRVDKSFK